MARRFIVVGAGLGGLATALRLAHRGHEVTVLEKTGEVGGRAKSVQVGGCRFDAGPTLMMMLDPFRKLFADVGERMEDHLDVRLCDPLYRVFFADGSQIEGTVRRDEMAARVRALAGSRDEAGYRRLLTDLETLYRDAVPNFVRKNFDGLGDFASPRQLALVARHHMVDNLARRAATYVHDDRLRMLFTFQTMYLGLSPFDAPWVYAVLTYMEYGEGIWYPMGGMAEVPRVVARLAEARGATIRLNAPVRSVDGTTVTLENGETLRADAVIVNADMPYAVDRLLEGQSQGPRRLPLAKPASALRHSCSAFMAYMDYDGELPGLLHHNVFFGADFKGNLEAIFREPLRVPDAPAFYACVSSKTEPGLAPPGRSNLYVLVPCPNLDAPLTPADEQKMLAHVQRRLCEAGGFDPDRVLALRTYGPRDWAADLNLSRGAAFGLSHDFWQSAFFRPSNRDRAPGLYYVGASSQPGNGLPMVLVSAELVEHRLVRDGLA
jgi:phytoene desaturase